MVIDPWNINGQQYFSLSCEREWGEGVLVEEKEPVYLMLILYCKKARSVM